MTFVGTRSFSAALGSALEATPMESSVQVGSQMARVLLDQTESRARRLLADLRAWGPLEEGEQVLNSEHTSHGMEG